MPRFYEPYERRGVLTLSELAWVRTADEDARAFDLEAPRWATAPSSPRSPLVLGAESASPESPGSAWATAPSSPEWPELPGMPSAPVAARPVLTKRQATQAYELLSRRNDAERELALQARIVAMEQANQALREQLERELATSVALGLGLGAGGALDAEWGVVAAD
jgi:hypothetical protein